MTEPEKRAGGSMSPGVLEFLVVEGLIVFSVAVGVGVMWLIFRDWSTVRSTAVTQFLILNTLLVVGMLQRRP